MPKILLVEDALDFRTLVERTLVKDCQVVSEPDLAGARKRLAEDKFDLILLDVMLPDGDGIDFCKSLRSSGAHASTPVIILTGKSDVNDKVNAFSGGAEDYLVKPFHPLELRARVEARLSRSRTAGASDILEKGALRLNVPVQRAEIRTAQGNSDLDLTPIEFKLLLFFIRGENTVYSRKDLMSSVWGEGVHVISRTVDAHVSNMRKKIRGSGYTIKSVHRVGYRFVLETEGAASAA